MSKKKTKTKCKLPEEVVEDYVTRKRRENREVEKKKKTAENENG